MTRSDRIAGSLLGGALGDVLGAPVEFLKLDGIRQRFGPDGITDLVSEYGRIGAITDDTQMTLFTAEGLLRAWTKGHGREFADTVGVIHHAYLRWLLTQGRRPQACANEIGTDGWLFGVDALHAQRAPGLTCLSALSAARSTHATSAAANDSKGCGAVMRMAPVGLIGAAIGGDEDVFRIAAEAGALTHGHPSGYLAAGHLSVTIAALVAGESLPRALERADAQLEGRHDAEELHRALAQARALAARGRPTPEALETLGGGWVGEEALAIAICCALVAEDFRAGVILAANHGGDTDSTAAIAGNVLGARLGAEALPAEWLARLEVRDEIARLARDFAQLASGTLPAETLAADYPGW